MRELVGQMASRILWDLGAIRVSAEQPFRLTSGNFSPIYINCRRLISDAPSMDMIAAFAHWLCRSVGIQSDVLAGGESAGIPFASYLASRVGKPMVYVRKRPKDHGLASQVEGELLAGARVLLVEDLITDGQSKLEFVAPLRAQGGVVQHCLVVFDRLQGGAESLREHGIQLVSMTDIQQALGVGHAASFLTSGMLQEVREYLAAPEEWHRAKGLAYHH
jgi:orotate phosphoribosyltransferase